MHETMKLRHRRGAFGGEGPILPLTTNVNSSSTTIRQRRRRPVQPEIAAKCAVCCLIVCIILVMLIAYMVLAFLSGHNNRTGSQAHKFLPRLPKRERTRMASIKCADGTTVGFIDDDYCDCDDGIDEPNTSACSNLLVNKQSFRCKDGITIHASRVKDGVFDCPDQTDERSQ